MKLCISTLACPAWDLETIVRVAREHRIGGIDFRGLQAEIDITKLEAFNEGLGRTLALLRENDIVMPCLNTSITLMAPGERWSQMLDECQRTTLLASRTGTPFLRVFGGAIPKEMSRDEAITLALRRLRQLSKLTRNANCTSLIETHDDWTTVDQIRPLLADTDPDDVGVLWDIEHTHRRGEDAPVTVHAHGDRLRHVHIKDSLPVAGAKSEQKLIGEGDLSVSIDIAVHALRTSGYKGWYCLETEKRWQASAPEPEQSIPNFAQYMRKLWAVGAR